MLLSQSYIPALLPFTADAPALSTFSTLFHGTCFSSFREFFLSISSPYQKMAMPLKLLPTVWWHQCQNEVSSSQGPIPHPRYFQILTSSRSYYSCSPTKAKTYSPSVTLFH